MTSSKDISSQRPSSDCRIKNWQNVIWREWRNCGDKEYARHLFELMINEPTDWKAGATLGLLGLLSGALGSGLLIWLLHLGESNLELTGWGALGGVVIGGIAGLLLALGTEPRRRPSWRAWLEGLTPNRLPTKMKPLQLMFFVGLFLRLMIIGLSAGMSLEISGRLFLGQSNLGFGEMLFLFAELIVASFLGFLLNQRAALISLLVGWLAGGISGWLFGPSPELATVLGLGTVAGLFLGQWAGLIGVLVGQMAAIVLALMIRSNLSLVALLSGLLIGGLVGGLNKLYQSAGKLKFARAYAHRAWYLWWHRRPPITKLEAILRRYATGGVWGELFHRLETEQELPQSLSDLQEGDWIDHFVAYRGIVALGSDVLPHLLDIASDKSNPLRRTAQWLARSIAYETTARLAHRTDHLLCPQCLTNCGPQVAKQADLSVAYSGCRTCGQSREFLHRPQGIVAVLDAAWTEAQSHQDSLLRINWLARRSLFDFDWVEIVQASDEDVERFAVQIGNDTDPYRKPHYKEMCCLIAPGCRLSENTLRVLWSTFGQVERGQAATRWK